MNKYTPLGQWLNAQGEDVVAVPLGDVERILGFPLPASARRYAAFWVGNQTVGGELEAAGWHAYPRLSSEAIEFRRTGIAAPMPPAGASRASAATPDFVLIGCVKTKRPGRHPARDLYTSPLFLRRMTYAESTGKPWYVLSARYGLIAPDDVVESYDESLVDASTAARRIWAERVLSQVDERLGPLAGKTVEIHAGEEYRDARLLAGLRERGARVSVPLEGAGLGAQLAWYGAIRTVPAPRAPTHTHVRGPGLTPPDQAHIRPLARLISEDLLYGRFNLSERAGAVQPGWDAMPEVVVVKELRRLGASASDVRVFVTLLAAMDRARDADRLWHNGVRLFREARWAFDPAACGARPLSELREAMASTGVSQRHIGDSAGWRLIMEALADARSPDAVRRAVFEGLGDAQELIEALTARTAAGQPRYPFLSGPKISEMWIRMLALPGGAEISRLDQLNVAVDVQVRKVTEYLGVTDTGGRPLDDGVRNVIQRAWRSAADDVVAPEGLNGTAAGLDPGLWFMGKWGCTFCERAGHQLPVSRACTNCLYHAGG